jgi:malonyl-CoA O-methyltransferase
LSARSPAIDRRAARRRFERAAPTYLQAARLEGEVAARMLERLDYIRLAPRRVLDAGSGPPRRDLGRRYPKASIIALDFALPMLARRTLLARFVARNIFPVCADLERLPLAAGSIDLAWSNMALHWVDEPLAVFTELHRALAPEGLLMFSTLGPDSLKELRAAAGDSRVHRFIDMHDLGDMLLAAGLSNPVMDMEMLTFAYADAERLLSDLRASGQTSALSDRPRGLASRRFAGALRRALGDKPRVSFEVVYGHAWKAEQVKTVRVFKSIP